MGGQSWRIRNGIEVGVRAGGRGWTGTKRCKKRSPLREIRGESSGLEYSVKDGGSGGRNQLGFRARVLAKVRNSAQE